MLVIKMVDLDLNGKCVLICEDLNVFVKEGKVIFDVCICVVLLIIKLVLEKGVKVMVMLYFGCFMEGEYDEVFLFVFVVDYLNNVFE